MSERRRWQPPPMDSEPSSSNKVRLDEKVVRKALQVNPALRQGRTTNQVKRDLEAGKSSPPAAPAPSRNELDDTLAFFVRGKADALAERLAAIAERRKALDAEELAAKREARDALASFVGLLDEAAVALHGAAALAKHEGFLARLELTPTALLDAVAKGRKKR
jgi:hypothetical protein